MSMISTFFYVVPIQVPTGSLASHWLLIVPNDFILVLKRAGTQCRTRRCMIPKLIPTSITCELFVLTSYLLLVLFPIPTSVLSSPKNSSHLRILSQQWGRVKGSEKEAVGACRAYITASEDSLRGDGKTKEKFHSLALAEFSRLKGMSDSVFKNSDRTGEAIVRMFKKARCEFLKLEGIMMFINNRKPTSSPPDDDIMRATTAIYNDEGTIATMYSYFNDKKLSYGACFPFF